jgi:hypothetical protein
MLSCPYCRREMMEVHDHPLNDGAEISINCVRCHRAVKITVYKRITFKVEINEEENNRFYD